MPNDESMFAPPPEAARAMVQMAHSMATQREQFANITDGSDCLWTMHGRKWAEIEMHSYAAHNSHQARHSPSKILA
jgi:hypothetical protein